MSDSNPQIREAMIERGARWFAGLRDTPASVAGGPKQEPSDTDRAYAASFLSAVLSPPDEQAVERVARALHWNWFAVVFRGREAHDAWTRLTDEKRERWRRLAHAAIHAYLNDDGQGDV